MTQVKNTATGPRMLTVRGGKQIFLQPGETKDVPLHRIPHLPDGVDQLDPGKVDLAQVEGEDIPDQPESQAPAKKPAQVTHQDLEDAKTKADLIAIAEAEGIDVEVIEGTGAQGNVLMDDIKAAIADKRAQPAS